VHTDGGVLVVAVADDLSIRLTGPAQRVLRGEFSADFTAALEAL
jgi:diaminopimelate epimerase